MQPDTLKLLKLVWGEYVEKAIGRRLQLTGLASSHILPALEGRAPIHHCWPVSRHHFASAGGCDEARLRTRKNASRAVRKAFERNIIDYLSYLCSSCGARQLHRPEPALGAAVPSQLGHLDNLPMSR